MLITFSMCTVLLHYNMFTQSHLAEYLTHVQHLLINTGKIILAKLLHNSIIIFSEDISRNIIV